MTASVASPSTLSVLIVDDEAPARARLRDLLADIAAEVPNAVVGEAANGVLALEAIEGRAVDVMLLDIRMPKMDGIELARHLGRLESSPAIVFVTAFDSYAVQAFELNAIDYLVKPVSSAQLWAVLGRWLRDVLPSDPEEALPLRARSAPEPAPARDVEVALDLTVLMGLPGVNGKRESPMLQRLLAVFVGETARNVRALCAGVESGDDVAVKALAHKMKSGCLAVGAVRLAVRARSLDERIKAGARPGPDDAAEIAEAWEACKQVLLQEKLFGMDALMRAESPVEQ